jgi:hypothetical protein
VVPMLQRLAARVLQSAASPAVQNFKAPIRQLLPCASVVANALPSALDAQQRFQLHSTSASSHKPHADDNAETYAFRATVCVSIHVTDVPILCVKCLAPETAVCLGNRSCCWHADKATSVLVAKSCAIPMQDPSHVHRSGRDSLCSQSPNRQQYA